MSGHISSPRQQPAYTAAQELTCTVGRVHFSDDDGGTVIFTSTAGDKVILESAGGSVHEGDQLRLFGVMEVDKKYGEQWRCSTWLPSTGLDRRGVEAYLARHCTGIGKTLASKLYDAYNRGAVRTLREQPEKVANDGILDIATAQLAAGELDEAKTFEAVAIELHGLFAGRGLGAKAIDACIKRWKTRAAEFVRRNPFSLLLAGIPRAGFRTCDRFYLELGGDPAALKRQTLAGWAAVHDAQTGSTWHPYTLFFKGVVENLDRTKVDLPGAAALAQRSGLLVEKRFSPTVGYCADPRQAANEFNLSQHIKRLYDDGAVRWMPVGFPEVREHQAAALVEAMRSPVFLLTGTPGTGKTFVLAAILRAVARVHGENNISVCAPTNKAAVRVTEAMRRNGLDIKATSVHRQLGVVKAGYDGNGWAFEYNADNPMPYTFYAVDEVSMLDVDLAAAWFAALPRGAHVVLVGDPNQLPSVGHGRVLADMVGAGMPRADLVKVERNAGLITRSCQLIKEGKRFETCEAIDVDKGLNWRHIEKATDVEQLDALRSIVEALRKKCGPTLADDLQVLTWMNDKGRISRKPLNCYLQALINPLQPQDARGMADGFRLRDKVCCRDFLKTDIWHLTPGMNVHDVASWSRTPNGLFDARETVVVKGEIGTVLAVSKVKPEIIVAFTEPNRRIKWLIGGKIKDKDHGDGDDKKDLNLGYALTVHYAQGSEWKYVVVMVDEAASRVASREGIYTAISRASKWVITIGRRAVLERQVRRAELPGRKTFLKELILESFDEVKNQATGEGVDVDTDAGREEGGDAR
jgi:exodeoxyribonuclease V alpha subunit